VSFWYGDQPHSVRRVTADTAWLPRRWIRRPKGSLAAVEFEWTPESQMQPMKFEALSKEFRGCEFRLFQAFPVSRCERGADKLKPECALGGGGEARATFPVATADRYTVKLQFAADRGLPPVEVLLDGKPLGTADVAAARVEGEGIAPSNPPALGPVG